MNKTKIQKKNPYELSLYRFSQINQQYQNEEFVCVCVYWNRDVYMTVCVGLCILIL